MAVVVLRVLCILFTAGVAFSAGASPDADAQAPALRAGTPLDSSSAGRDMLKYIVRCALPHGQSLDVPHDGVRDHLVGEFGLAPDWSHAPLSESGRRWVSACVLGFVNALGVHVLVSMRGAQENLKATITDDERKQFTYQEAAFYGDIFSTAPVAYVCRGRGGSTGSLLRSQRVCSDPSEQPSYSRCGMLITGDCADVCTSEDPLDHAFSHCRGGGRIYDEVVTVFLPAAP
jgi:hypothetical protein